jgi:hypothetical protein
MALKGAALESGTTALQSSTLPLSHLASCHNVPPPPSSIIENSSPTVSWSWISSPSYSSPGQSIKHLNLPSYPSPRHSPYSLLLWTFFLFHCCCFSDISPPRWYLFIRYPSLLIVSSCIALPLVSIVPQISCSNHICLFLKTEPSSMLSIYLNLQTLSTPQCWSFIFSSSHLIFYSISCPVVVVS